MSTQHISAIEINTTFLKRFLATSTFSTNTHLPTVHMCHDVTGSYPGMLNAMQCLQMWELRHPTTLWFCTANYRDSLTLPVGEHV